MLRSDDTMHLLTLTESGEQIFVQASQFGTSSDHHCVAIISAEGVKSGCGKG